MGATNKDGVIFITDDRVIELEKLGYTKLELSEDCFIMVKDGV